MPVPPRAQSWTPQLVLGPLRQAPPSKWVAALWAGVLTVIPLTLGIVMLAGGAGAPRAARVWRRGQQRGAATARANGEAATPPLPPTPHPQPRPLGRPPTTPRPPSPRALPRRAAGTFGAGAARGPAVAAITAVLSAFCLVFAVNSAIHSYLIVAYAEGDKARRGWGRAHPARAAPLAPPAAAAGDADARATRPPARTCAPRCPQVAQTVGVYYGANAVGRLVGTLASGARLRPAAVPRERRRQPRCPSARSLRASLRCPPPARDALTPARPRRPPTPQARCTATWGPRLWTALARA